jgi:hypothetical protein
MDNLTHDELIAIVKALARAVVLNQAEVQAFGIALASSRIVPFAERMNMRADCRHLLDLLDKGTPNDFLQAFERSLPNP